MSGFLVVRLPYLNRDPAGRGVYSKHPPCWGTVCYGGIDRMAWFDIDEELYAGTLPKPIDEARASIRTANADDFSGIEVCQVLDVALMLLRYSNRTSVANELIVLRSEKLAEIKGAIDFEDSETEWTGYDIVSLGNWSLVECLFAERPALAAWRRALNEFGLFASPELATEYVQAYEAATGEGTVEELPESVYGIDIIEVGRVHVGE